MVRLMSYLSLAHSALMTGHSTYMYFSVSVHVSCQQSWLANGSWKPAHSVTSVLFRDASHHLLMTDCGGYMTVIIRFSRYLVMNKHFISFLE